MARRIQGLAEPRQEALTAKLSKLSRNELAAWCDRLFWAVPIEEVMQMVETSLAQAPPPKGRH